MSYSVNKLITNAFYLSKVRSKDFQTVGGDDIAVGLDLFNKVLSQTSANTRMIPYYSEVTVAAVIGQEKYFIPNLVEPFSLTFNMTTVRYATNQLSRREFHSTTRIDGVVALPFNVSFERCHGSYVVGGVTKYVSGCDMYVQYLPADIYPFKIWGKFGLDQVTTADLPNDLTTIYDIWYIDYLEHCLTKRICNYYGVPINPEVQAIIEQISANVNDMNPIDLTSRRLNVYGDKNGLGWASVNLGRGFEP